MLLVLVFIVGSVLSVPQGRNENEGRRKCPRPGSEFLDLLPADFRDDEYDQLLEVFTNFLDVLATGEDYFTVIKSFEEFLVAKKSGGGGDYVNFVDKECTPKQSAYKLEDPEQCDRYWTCSTQGKLNDTLCADGMVYDHPGKSCNLPQRVECAKRTKLQPAQPAGDCLRQNGFFNDEEDVTKCNKYISCTNGKALPYQCSTGLVWSPSDLSCTRPGQAKRPKCVKAAAATAEFICPDTNVLKFGSYNTYDAPNDCTKFFICFSTRDFNKASCDEGTFFDKAIGSCQPAETVVDCDEDGKRIKEEDTIEEDYEEEYYK